MPTETRRLSVPSPAGVLRLAQRWRGVGESTHPPAERKTARMLDCRVTRLVRLEETQMAKGQQKQKLGKTNKPKVTTKAKQAKKAEKKAGTTFLRLPTAAGDS